MNESEALRWVTRQRVKVSGKTLVVAATHEVFLLQKGRPN